MTRILPACALSCALLAASAITQADGHAVKADLSDPITLRMHMMKQVGGAMKLAVPMVKGQAPYDARVAMGAFRTMNAVALGYAAQFPDGTQSGLGTEASSKIWSDRAGFEAAVAKFLSDTEAAVNAAPNDVDGFRAAFDLIAANCKSCHEAYRVKN